MSGLLNSTIGEYRLVDFLGEGGMGEVYRGVHARLGRIVAVKLLKTDPSQSAMAQRFLNEARIQSALRHPGIATLYDFFEWQQRLVIVMEYVDGQTLSDRVAAVGALPPYEVVAIGGGVADTLAYIHSQGIVHRDVKGNNIKIAADGQAKLLDFGIARSQQDARLTRTGFLIGTFENLSPEQVMGEEATPASDIWALGTVLYQMATGRPAFEAQTPPELFTKIAKAECLAPSVLNPGVGRDLETVIMRCLRKKPHDRYETAERVRDDLARVQVSLGVQQRVTPNTPSRPLLTAAVKPMQTKWGIAGAAVAVLVIAGGVALLRTPGPVESKTQPPPLVLQPPDKPNADDGQPTSGKVTLKVQGDMDVEVWRNGQQTGKITPDTPYSEVFPFGQRLDVVLKRRGCDEIPVQLTVEKKEYNYTYTLNCR